MCGLAKWVIWALQGMGNITGVHGRLNSTQDNMSGVNWRWDRWATEVSTGRSHRWEWLTHHLTSGPVSWNHKADVNSTEGNLGQEKVHLIDFSWIPMKCRGMRWKWRIVIIKRVIVRTRWYIERWLKQNLEWIWHLIKGGMIVVVFIWCSANVEYRDV